MMKKFLFLTLLFVLTAPLLHGQELLNSSFSRDTILIGDQVEWSARVNVPRDIEIWMDSIPNPIVPGVELIKPFEYDTLSLKKRGADIEVKAILTSFDSGSYYLPRQVIYFYKGQELMDTIVMEARNLEVTTIPIDTTTFQMYDIKPQYIYPITFKEVLPWILGLIVIIVVIILIIKMIQKRKVDGSLFGKAAVQEPPHIVALRELEKIRGEKLWQNHKEKLFYTQVTDTLRQYIEGRFNISAMERTSNEIIDSLSAEKLSSDEFEELKELFYTADLVKFAKYKATDAENERTIPTAVRFVNSTFLQEIEGDKVKEDRIDG